LFVRRFSTLILWIIPLPFLSVAYRPGELGWFMLAGTVQGLLIGAAGWTIIRRSGQPDVDADEPVRQETIAAAALLAVGWAIASLALNMGDPPVGRAWLATTADQLFRYGALVAGFVAALAGLTVLAVRLYASGQRTLSVIGATAAALSTLLFTVLFVPYPHILTARFTVEAGSGTAPAWWPLFTLMFSSIQMVQRMLIYTATLLYAAALWRGRFLGPTSVTCLVGLTLVVAGANTIIHVPPAVPLVLPYWMGVALMQQTGARTQPA
jgi:hypothetical protein